MGGLVYFYRLGSLTLATITAVIVLGLCSSSTSAFHSVLGGVFNGQSLTYANLGIASGAMAIITLPIMIFVDFINDGRTGLPILIEVPWLCVLWVMFLATGISTKNFVHDNWTVPNGSGATCDEIDSRFPDVRKICNEWTPIEIVSWISAGLLFLYSITLLIISVMRSYGGRSMWGTSVKNSEI